MPHVIVKLYPGRSEEQKTQLADEIVNDIVAIAKCDEKSVSVAFEEIEKEAIRLALQRTGGNRSESCEILGISVRTLQRKIKEYEL